VVIVTPPAESPFCRQVVLGVTIAEYILYCFDGPKLARCDHFMAESDEAAVTEALLRQGMNSAELWCGSRKVKDFAAVGAGQGPSGT
jgi:hypothetical protein